MNILSNICEHLYKRKYVPNFEIIFFLRLIVVSYDKNSSCLLIKSRSAMTVIIMSIRYIRRFIRHTSDIYNTNLSMYKVPILS